MSNNHCRETDLTRGWTAVGLWCLPVAALALSTPMGDARWWIWTPSLTVMGTACVANATRCGRRHCYLTGPVFLAGAVLSVLRGFFAIGPSWNWISAIIVAGWAVGWTLERVAGSYVRRDRLR